jgi:putative tricarboxylic transport membrane protein
VNSQRAGSLVLLAVGLYGLILTVQLPMGKWNEPGAGAFPLLVSILLCCAGGFIFFRSKTVRPIDWRDVVRRQWVPFQIAASTAGFILALERLGYLVTASLYAFALLFWVSGYRFWVAAGLALGLGAGSWLVFAKVFATPLPTGVLGF